MSVLHVDPSQLNWRETEAFLVTLFPDDTANILAQRIGDDGSSATTSDGRTVAMMLAGYD